MTGAPAETLAAVLLALALAAAMVRPFGVPEVFVALPGALVSVIVGASRKRDASSASNTCAQTAGELELVVKRTVGGS